MPRHSRGSSGVPSLLLQQHHAPPHASGGTTGSPHHSPGYGLIQPLPPLSIPHAPPIVHRHHKRLSSSTLTPPWADWEIDLHEWKERGLGFGKDVGGRIGGRFPGVRYSAAFFSALHTNLALSTAIGPPSPDFTPPPPFAAPHAPFALPTPPPSPTEPSSASTSATPPSAKTPSTASLSPLSTPPHPHRHRAVSFPTPPAVPTPTLAPALEPTITPATSPDQRRAALTLLATTAATDRAAHAVHRLRDPVNLALLAAFAGLCVASLAPGFAARRAGDALLGGAGVVVLLHRLRPDLAARYVPAGVHLPDALAKNLEASLAWVFRNLHLAVGGMELGDGDSVLVAQNGEAVVGAVVYRLRAPPSHDTAKRDSLHPAQRATARRSSSAGSASSSGTAATSASSTGSTTSVIQAPAMAPKNRKARRKKSTATTASTASAEGSSRRAHTVAVRAWVVAPEYRGRGLGRSLLHAAVAAAATAAPGVSWSALGAVWDPPAAVGRTVAAWAARVQAWWWGAPRACTAAAVPGWAGAVLERVVASGRVEREGARGRGRGRERRRK